MLEDQVAFLLQKYLGNYVRGLNKEALKISVWRGDVELTNMQLKPEALNALKLPVKVKAGFLGSVRLKVPWSKLGQEPVLVYLDRIFLLAEPATQIEGCSENAIQEAKKNRLRESEMKLLEQQQQLKSELNTSWLGSFISTIIGNLKLSITNIHVRYEDTESNPGHPFAAGLTLSRLSAVTVDASGKETFATGGALEHIQKSVQLDRLAFYFDSDISPWHIEKSWADLVPSEWNQVFELGVNQSFKAFSREHDYILQPVTGKAKYMKLRIDESRDTGQALQQAVINLDDVTLCLSKDGYRDILKLGDNFAAFNQRLKYAHYRPQVPVKSDPKAWWRYAYKVVADEAKKASGKLSWEQVLHYARIRKRYLSLYASLLKSDLTRMVVDDNEEINKLDCELEIGVILQWRMLAHKFVEQSIESDIYQNKKKEKQSWWPFGWTSSGKGDNGPKGFTEEDWERLNKVIGYKDGSDENLLTTQEANLPHLFLEIHMKHNASKLIGDGQECLADLSCEGLACSLKTFSETKVFDFKLESYRLLSPNGLLAESAHFSDSFVGVFTYKPFDAEIDWSFVAKASPCYMTYLKDSIDQIISFFKSNTSVTQNLALETAAAVQMTIDGVRRTAQQQVTQALRDRSRFLIDLDISAPKITIPTNFYPDDHHSTKLLLDLGNLMLCTEDYWDSDSSEDNAMYLQFSLILNDVSAFLVDGDYHWREKPIDVSACQAKFCNFFPVIDKCGIALKLQQIHSENPFYPSMRIAVRLPSLGFHFSPARYHRLLQIAKFFQDEDGSSDAPQPWSQADFEGWLSVLTWKGIGNREAVWQRRYLCLVGSSLYILENLKSQSYKQYISLRGKQAHQVPKEFTGGLENVLAVYDATQSNLKVEDVNTLVLLFDSDESRKTWQNRIQGAIYRVSGAASITVIPETSYTSDVEAPKSSDSKMFSDVWNIEKLLVTGVLDELRICFNCCYESNLCFKNVLLGKENKLFEFRALGGQVELSIKEEIIYVGTLLKSLEILDQYQLSGASPRYLARSFIKNTTEAMLDYDQLNKADSEDKFFEASDELDDAVLHPTARTGSITDYFASRTSSLSLRSSMKPPSFNRIPGLMPSADITSRSSSLETTDTMDSFVKAQVVIYSQDSPHYDNLDNRVVITLATLSFFCHRPTILAILGFVNAINISEENLDPSGNGRKPSTTVGSTSKLDSVDEDSIITQEPLAKGFLGKGKTRIIFYLSLNMVTAQIFLMNEDGISLATLSQSNLLADIKVFSSSFSIKAALGNLKISDDTLPGSHSYFWMCDMRNPGGKSFVELDFSSYDEDDEDYNDFDYSLTGHLSEVRIVYLNRFVQEILSYFMGLVPSDSENFVKLKDNATNSEKRVPTSEIAGSPALKLDLSLTRPIILMPRRTDSDDYLKLDALHITVQNTFQWLGGDKNDMNAVHLDIMTIMVEDINLTVGTGTTSGESIIQDVNGLSVVIQRSLRDLTHQIPATEVTIQIEILKAALSNKEYEIITDCASSNISETPSTVPTLDKAIANSEKNKESQVSVVPTVMVSEPLESERWITIKVSVSMDFVELSLHSGTMRDSPLASVQVRGAWLLYKSNSFSEGFLFATLKDFLIIDAREGIKDEFRLAIGKSWNTECALHDVDNDDNQKSSHSVEETLGFDLGHQPIPSMLILDATFRNSSTNISLCVQRPKLLVALDFLLAIAEFFVPSLRSILSDDEDSTSLPLVSPIILDQQIYVQPSSVFSLSPQKPLIVDDEKFEDFTYDGKGGKLVLKNRDGRNASDSTTEIIIHVGNRKRLQFKNVTIVNGHCLDSCVFLGSNSSYSALEENNVFLEEEEKVLPLDNQDDRSEDTVVSATAAVDGSTELVIELQAIGPELTFYNSSEEVGRSLAPAKKAIHANLDAFCRLVMKSDNLELNGNVIGLKMESNGIRILEPFDTSLNFSNTSGKTNIHLSVSDIFMNFSFSILRLFLAVEEDVLSFLRMTSRKVSVMCSQFDKVGTILSKESDQIYAFWRPRAPSGFAVLGDCLTPLNEPPSKGVLAVNTSFAKVKRPVSYRLIWSFKSENTASSSHDFMITAPNTDDSSANDYSIWFPVAPKGYVAVSCVVSPGIGQPSLSSALCIMSSLVSPCELKDCIVFQMADMAFWRVNNSFGSFLPANTTDMSVDGKAYDLRHMIFSRSEKPEKTLKNSVAQSNHQTSVLERPVLTSGRLFEIVASFKLIWWNQGTNTEKKLSIWRPVVPHGMIFLGDLAVQGYEPPNSAIVLHDTGDEAFLKCPQDFQTVGHIKKYKGNDSIYFWWPLAPPGFVSFGCVASKGPPKGDDFNSLRCIRSDMVTSDQFSEENIWDTSASAEPFSLWGVGYEVGTFIARKGFKKPPKRFALKLAIPNVSNGSDDTVIDAKIKTFSVAVFDDYGGLMVPLFNVSLNSIGFNLHGRPDYMNSTVSYSLAARSYNDKYDSWEPLIEPMDGFLRYQYDPSAAGPATQVRMTSTKDLNLNLSVSNANMIFQAYASWNNLSLVDESYVNGKAFPLKYDEGFVNDIHHRRNYFIIPQNKLGQDIYIRAAETNGLSNIIKMPSGGNKRVKVLVSNNMLDSHSKGGVKRVSQSMLTVIISEAEFPVKEGMTSSQYTVAVRLFLFPPSESSIQQQSARTCGADPDSLRAAKSIVKWDEILFFKADIEGNYMMEFIVIDMGKGEPIGIYSSPLKQLASVINPSSSSQNSYDLTWRNLYSAKRMDFHDDVNGKVHGRIKCAVLLSIQDEVNKGTNDQNYGRRAGLIQISPTLEGPWTTVRLNYASPAACWRLGNEVVASEVLVKDGNRYVSIRSLVSITNSTNFSIDLRLKSKGHEKLDFLGEMGESDDNRIHTDEFFETDKYNPSDGWASCSQWFPSSKPSFVRSMKDEHQEEPSTRLPDGWEWVDEWQVDTSAETPDGWVYAPDIEHLKWPETSDHKSCINYARQRRWIRHRKYASHSTDNEIPVGLLEPGHTIPLPLSCLVHPGLSFALQLRPKVTNEPKEYSWSSVVEKHALKESLDNSDVSEISVSSLIEADELLYCSEINEVSTDKGHGLWFCLTIQATQIGKDIHSDPIQDWKLVISSPLSITNFLPLSAEYSVSCGKGVGECTTCSQGTLVPGKSVKIYNADIQEPLYLVVFPLGGWDPINEPILISNSSKISSRMMSFRNSYSGRIVTVIIEQNFVKDRLIAKTIKIYVPYWIASARCPPLTYYFIDKSGKREKRHFSIWSHSNKKTQKVLCQIADEEMTSGYTIASALNFKYLGIYISLENSGKEEFEPVRDLSPLGDMDGSIDLYAYDTEGKCMRIFISSKPSPYESIPTKVILVRPFLTFTNRIGRDLFIKFNNEDQPKVLRASDTRVSFVYCEAGAEKIQVRLQNTSWCLPLEIEKEDIFTILLRKHNGDRTYLRAEVRGYEEGSRFLLVLRLEPENGPLRIENRMTDRTVAIRQTGLNDDSWVQLEPLSTSNYSWDDPSGQRCIDVSILNEAYFHKISLDESNDSTDLKAHEVKLHIEEVSDIKVVRFMDDRRSIGRLLPGSKKTELPEKLDGSSVNKEMQVSTSPIELLIELGIVGVSLIDHHPRELLYLYLEKVFISYSTGYDAGKTNRFKIILGKLQLDSQLPLTVMPVILAPEDMPDINHPVFKTTITLSNESSDGIHVYPYVYVRVSDKCWRINIHEPIIWALVDFYNSLRLDSIPSSSDVTQVDPEIRIDLIDVSEIRLKLSLETSPNQRPHGALGMWGPILSAVGNAFKLQLHLRKVMHRSRFMRKSFILPSIVNRIKRDLIHNPLHLIFSLDVLSMTKSTLASLSKGFAELSTDRQFLQLRSKQVWSRRITGFGDGILQGTEAFAQGIAFGVTGVLTKPVENARQHGFLGFAHGIGRAFLGVVVQPLSGALDFVSLTVDGIGASFSKCLDILNNKATAQRIRNPRSIHANGVINEYCHREAVGQMILYLAEASRHLSCADLFKEPSKYAWSDFYEDHFIVPYHRLVLITNKRVMLLQALSLEKLDKRPSKIIWDVPWEEVLALELAKAGHSKPSHLIIHLKTFRKSESFVRVVRCNVDEEEGQEPQAVVICSCIRKMWKAHQSDVKVLTLKVPSSQRHVQFAWEESEGRDSYKSSKPMIKPRGFPSTSSLPDEMRFKKHCVNFQKIWSSEQEYRSRCTLFPKQVVDDGTICSIWRPICPNGYISVGDVAHIGNHSPHVAAIYRESDERLSLPIGYDLVWRNCSTEYTSPLSIWLPRPLDGFVAVGCVAVSAFEEPPLYSAYCISTELAARAEFEQMVWTAPDSYPWACYIYQVQSEALHFIALRQPKEVSDWRPVKVSDHEHQQVSEVSTA